MAQSSHSSPRPVRSARSGYTRERRILKIVRASSGAIAALFSLLFIPQILVELLPDTWKAPIGRYLPMQAGAQLFSQRPESGMLGPWTGFAVFCAYAAIALVIGFVLIQRRDA